MTELTPPDAQTPDSTGLPADLFQKAQDAATEKGRPIYVYRAERAGRYASKWDPVEGATPAAVVQPRPAGDAAAVVTASRESDPGGAMPTATSGEAAEEPPSASTATSGGGERVTLYAAGGQTAAWEQVSEVVIDHAGAVLRFRDRDGAIVRVVVGGGSVVVQQG